MKFTAIRSEGGLIPYDLLGKIANEEIEGQKPADFGLPKGRRLVDEIQRVWSDSQELWARFKQASANLPPKDPHGTSATRDRWIVPLLTDPMRLNYDLKAQPSAIVLDGLTFPISHRAGESEENPPVHIEGFAISLDQKPAKLRTSPRAMVQEFLNHSEAHLWGIVTNGLSFRLLRDTARTSRPTYLDFDLEIILEAGLFNEFALFYRLCHRSRLPKAGQPIEDCLLEKYYQLSVEQGGRVRDKLRDGVEQALRILGTGFLRHPENQALRDKFPLKSPNPQEFHRQLLRLIYRLLFLIVAEERHMILATGEDFTRNQNIYRDYYSIGRLRERAEVIIEPSDFSDLWIGLKQTFSLFSDKADKNPMGIPPLNGDLFSHLTMPDLDGTQLSNQDLLLAIRRLSLFSEGKILQRVNYSALDVEELGSVYESLLDYRPIIESESEGFEFKLETGGERKTTGSYYTKPELVRELIQSALVPVLEDRLTEASKEAKDKASDERGAKEKAILSVTVCDPACGSGHFLLEAARRLGKELARVRTGEDEPSPEQFHIAVRDVVSHCIYGVDLNPLAVDLCKLALWLEGHWTGKPLSFLDHRIKCGNSLIGVLNVEALEKGIPDEAFNSVTGDDKKVASAYKKRNRKEREGERRFDFEQLLTAHEHKFAELFGRGLEFSEETPADVRRKSEFFSKARESQDWWHDWTAANLWASAFFVPLKKFDDVHVPTQETFIDYCVHGKDRPQMTGNANAIASGLRFFHWFLEFPNIFEAGGFDVILGNPPWETMEFKEEEQWSDDPYISKAPSKAERTRRIQEYRESNDASKQERVLRFDIARSQAEASNKFLRGSSRYPLTATGKMNTFALFAELERHLQNARGRVGVLLPTAIATDDTYKSYFASLNQGRALVSLYDFENREALFPGVHRSYKFSLMTLSGKTVPQATFAFYCTNTNQLRDSRRQFPLSADEIALINPNSHTCPIFRSRADAELTKKIYSSTPVLVNDRKNMNPWGVRFKQGLFNLSTDSGLFETSQGDGMLPLYEGKMVQAYDHRAASVMFVAGNAIRQNQPVSTSAEEYADPHYSPRPLWWVPKHEVELQLQNWKHNWLIGFKDVTAATNERTAIFTVLPRVGVGHTLPLVFLSNAPRDAHVGCFLANANSLILDYIARQKVGGLHLTFGVLNQLPFLQPTSYDSSDIEYVLSRVRELVYTSWDMKSFANDMGFDGEPFPWNEKQRATRRAELDAYFSHLYRLSRDELRYVIDPKDVFGEEFPSETFRGLKENEQKQHGEYRTGRLVLAAFDELSKNERFRGESRECTITGKPWTVGE